MNTILCSRRFVLDNRILDLAHYSSNCGCDGVILHSLSKSEVGSGKELGEGTKYRLLFSMDRWDEAFHRVCQMLSLLRRQLLPQFTVQLPRLQRNAKRHQGKFSE